MSKSYQSIATKRPVTFWLHYITYVIYTVTIGNTETLYHGAQMPPTFCQDGPRDFLKIDEKIIGEGVVANLQRSRGRDQQIHLHPSYFYNDHAPAIYILPSTYIKSVNKLKK